MATGNTSIRVSGLREVLRVTDELPKELKKAVRDEIRKSVEPVRDDAQRTMEMLLSTHGASGVQRISAVQSVVQSGASRDVKKKTRFGISVRRAGVVSVEQRVKSKGTGKKRPKFVDLQMDKALLPAAAKNSAAIDQGMANVLERLQRKWVRG